MQSIATLLVFALIFNTSVFAVFPTNSIDGDMAGPSMEAPSVSTAPAAPAPAEVEPPPSGWNADGTPMKQTTQTSAKPTNATTKEEPKKEDNGLRCNGKKAAISVGASMMLAIPAIAVMSIKAPPGKAQTSDSETKVNQYQSYKNASGDNESSRNWLTGSASILGVLATVDGVFAASSIASGNYKESAKCIVSAAILGSLAAGQVIQIAQAEDARKANQAEADKLVSTCKTTLSVCGTVAGKSVNMPADCNSSSGTASDACFTAANSKANLESTKAKYNCADSVALMDCAEVVKAADPTSAAGKITDQQMAAAINKGLNSAFGTTVATSTSGVYTPAEVDNICKGAGLALDSATCKQWHADKDGKSKSAVKLAGLADQLQKNTVVKIPSEIINALKNPTESNVKAAMKTMADSPMGANLFSASEKEQLRAGNIKALTGIGSANSEANTVAGSGKKKSGEGFDPFASSGSTGGSSGGDVNLAGEAFSSRMLTSGDINSNINDSLFKMISTKYGEKFRVLKDGF